VLGRFRPLNGTDANSMKTDDRLFGAGGPAGPVDRIHAQPVITIGPAEMLVPFGIIARQRRQIPGALLELRIMLSAVQVALPRGPQRMDREKVPIQSLSGASGS
jgi:hypothetical protein